MGGCGLAMGCGLWMETERAAHQKKPGLEVMDKECRIRVSGYLLPNSGRWARPLCACPGKIASRVEGGSSPGFFFRLFRSFSLLVTLVWLFKLWLYSLVSFLVSFLVSQLITLITLITLVPYKRSWARVLFAWQPKSSVKKG